MALKKLVTVDKGWVDLYAATGIAVGTQIKIQNAKSDTVVAIGDTATQPTPTDGRAYVRTGKWLVNKQGDAGAWAYCQTYAVLNVQEV